MNVHLNKRHQRTLEAIFSTRTSATLQWRRIESLFIALGATKKEGRGSSVTFKLKGEPVTFHRPHPRKEASKYQVRDARDFLKRVGITP
ncbi:type II toxin-antitoxin system HicA family toxin [Candidatus Poribacteria bacterium]|nr:type II toxin-antitoxin system HicA family toxin [Candidatus Poribacteria bacterium]MXY28874.1 type II toxin-antitoxin system HicA family toxin [Candidatus Poribacteria bacterium]MYK19836.1 type II toxin-antitoxin system HicA family toxin [Candidatus Poribacteria bacterium]